MSVRPHPSKSKTEPGKWWHVDIGHGKDRLRLVHHGSFVEALEIEKSLRQSRPAEVAPSVAPKIRELVLPFLDWYKNEASPRTIRDFRFSINLYFIPWFGALQPKQLSLQLFHEFKEKLQISGLAPVTINKHLNYFSSMIKWAVANGHCQPLHFEIPRFPRKKTVSEPKKSLTQRQVNAIYAHLESRYRLSFILMVDHGLRQEEAMQITIDDIDENRKTIRVLGKGNKYRQVPFLSDRFEEELYKVLATRVSGPLAINEKTGKSFKTIWKALKRATAKAGIDREVNHHLLRHTFSTLAAENGMNPHALQRILGHSSIETTNKIYTHVTKDFIGDEARILRERKGV